MVTVQSYYVEKVMTFIHACAALVVYPEKGHNVPISVLPKFQQSLYNGIMRGFNTFHTIDSQHYSLRTSVTVLIAENEKAAIATGAKNLVALGDRYVKGSPSGDKEAIAVVFQEYGESYDRMLVNANAGKNDVRPHDYEGLSLAPSWETTFAHEFTHLMGARDLNGKGEPQILGISLLISESPRLPMSKEDFIELFTLTEPDRENFPPPPRFGQKDYKFVEPPPIIISNIIGSRNSHFEIRRAGGRSTTWVNKEKQ